MKQELVFVGPKSLPSLRKFPPSRLLRGTLENPRFVAFFLYKSRYTATVVEPLVFHLLGTGLMHHGRYHKSVV